jgi:acyl-CoA thioester hydrolase
VIYRRRVQFYETDAQGILHHSNYFRLFEETRSELLRSLGVPYSKLREEGYEVVLLEAECRFKKPIFYDEEVCVEIRLDSMDRYFFSFSYRLSVKDSLRAEGKTKHCFVKEGRLTSIPQKVRELFDV